MWRISTIAMPVSILLMICTVQAFSPVTHSFGSSTTLAHPSALYGISYVRCGRCQTSYEIDLDQIKGKGRRLECSVCKNTWFQSRDRVMEIREGFEMIPLPEHDLKRIETNIKEGKEPRFMGDSKLYVGNIPFNCHEDDLLEIFGRVGTVGEVSLIRDDMGKNRGFGFVTMRTEEDGQKAIDELDGSPVRGRNIAVRSSNN